MRYHLHDLEIWDSYTLGCCHHELLRPRCSLTYLVHQPPTHPQIHPPNARESIRGRQLIVLIMRSATPQIPNLPRTRLSAPGNYSLHRLELAYAEPQKGLFSEKKSLRNSFRANSLISIYARGTNERIFSHITFFYSGHRPFFSSLPTSWFLFS